MPNCEFLRQSHVCPKGKEVPRDAVWHVKRSHTGIPRFPRDIKYHGGRGGKGDVGSSLRPPGGMARDGVGEGRMKPDILRRGQEDWWEVPHLGTIHPAGFSIDVLTDGTGYEPGED